MTIIKNDHRICCVCSKFVTDWGNIKDNFEIMFHFNTAKDKGMTTSWSHYCEKCFEFFCNIDEHFFYEVGKLSASCFVCCKPEKDNDFIFFRFTKPGKERQLCAICVDCFIKFYGYEELKKFKPRTKELVQILQKA